jgi:ferredoxin/Flp pilus assembly protein TadD
MTGRAPVPPGSALPLLAPHQERCGASRGFGGSKRARWRWAVLLFVHVAAIAHVAHWKIAGTTVTPVEPSEAGQTLELGIVNAGFLLFVGATLLTLVVGRFFCGWVCHLVAYQDAAAWLLAKLGLRPRPIRSRLLMLVPLYAAFDMFVLPTLLRWGAGTPAPALTLELATNDMWQRFPGPAMAAVTLFVDGALIVWWLGAKGFCTYGCPYGAIFGLVDRAAPGRIRVTDACEGCGHCTAVCTSNVRVHEEVARYGQVVDSGCMKCLDCVSACPKNALVFGFAAQTTRAKPAALSARVATPRKWDFSWLEELALALVFAGALCAFRGLYGAVPFLLAIGLATCVAIGAVLAWRALRRPDLYFQRLWWKRGGKFTPAGGIGLSGLGAFVLFTAHSGWVNANESLGTRALEVTGRAQRGSPERRAHLERAVERLATALDAGLFPNARLENKLGQARLEAGSKVEAEAQLRRACELEPEWESPRIVLADLLAGTGRFDEAVEQLLQLLSARESTAAVARVAAAIAREQAPLARIAAFGSSGQREQATLILQRVLELRPDFEAARQLLAELAAPRD